MFSSVADKPPTMPEEAASFAPPFLVISGHDYRSKRRASIHFLSRELARLGATKFFSVGCSPLSLLKGDPRSSLWTDANQVEQHGGVACFLWKTPWHPVNLRAQMLAALEAASFHLYTQQIPDLLKQWITECKTIILESGLSIAFFDMIKSKNPHAKIIYVNSDALETIGCASYLTEKLTKVAPLFDAIVVPSPQLAAGFPAGSRVRIIPHGMDTAAENTAAPDIYIGRANLISVGSMLFDPSFFELAAAEFPHLTFHIIGGGRKSKRLRAPNIVVQGEMPFEETLPYVMHADVGIAAYRGEKVAPYLSDTSLKLLQFGAYGVPAVCPHIAAGEQPARFGYVPGDRASIVAALRAALQHGRFPGHAPPSWANVASSLLRLQGSTP